MPVSGQLCGMHRLAPRKPLEEVAGPSVPGQDLPGGDCPSPPAGGSLPVGTASPLRSPRRPSGVQPLPLSPPPSELGDKPPRFLTDPWGLFFNTASESPFHGPSFALETVTLLCPRLPFELLVSLVSWGLDQTGPAHAEMSDLRSGSLVIYCCE